MASASSSDAPSLSAASTDQALAELTAIDVSVRAPVLVLFGSAILWLLAGTALSLVAAIKLHTPSFLAGCEFLTYGRVQPAATNALVYGWGLNVGLGFALWLLARLAQSVVRNAGLLVVAAAFWNLGVTLGVGGILVGDSTSLEWLEMPRYATPLLLAAYAVIAAWAVSTLRTGRSSHTYVSQWYALAALCWFPWLYSAAQLMLVFFPARGTVQSVVDVWFAHNLQALWFTPVALAAVYYFLPKILGKPVGLYFLAPLGFWSLAVFSGWVGAGRLLGGPVPGWVQSAGVSAGLLMLVPVLIIALNVKHTLCGSCDAVRRSQTLRFVVLGAACFFVASLQDSLLIFNRWAEVTKFTYYNFAHTQGLLLGFYSMVMFGAVYFVVPRLLGVDWTCPRLMGVHFWAVALGLSVYLLALTFGGLAQGFALNSVPPGMPGKPGLPVPFLDIVAHTLPWLELSTLGLCLAAVGYLAFALNFAGMLLKLLCPSAAAKPADFRTPDALEAAAR